MNAVSKFFRRLFGKPTQVNPIVNEKAIERYSQAGMEFGDAVSYIYMGECIGFEKLLTAWETEELVYASMGFRTVSLDDFVSSGGWGQPLVLRIPRDIGEEPVYHAAYYRANYLGKLSPAIDFNKMMSDGQVQSGNYLVPSTEHLKEK